MRIPDNSPMGARRRAVVRQQLLQRGADAGRLVNRNVVRSLSEQTAALLQRAEGLGLGVAGGSELTMNIGNASKLPLMYGLGVYGTNVYVGSADGTSILTYGPGRYGTDVYGS